MSVRILKGDRYESGEFLRSGLKALAAFRKWCALPNVGSFQASAAEDDNSFASLIKYAYPFHALKRTRVQDIVE